MPPLTAKRQKSITGLRLSASHVVLLSRSDTSNRLTWPEQQPGRSYCTRLTSLVNHGLYLTVSMDRIFAVLVLGMLCQAAAQAEDRAAGGEAILFQDIPAVYGASKYEQKLSEAPAAVSIITADEIDKYG